MLSIFNGWNYPRRPQVPGMESCTGEKRLIELKVSTLGHFEDVTSQSKTALEIVKMNSRVVSGGRKASHAVARLRSPYPKHNAPLMMKVLGTSMVSTHMAEVLKVWTQVLSRVGNNNIKNIVSSLWSFTIIIVKGGRKTSIYCSQPADHKQ
eukprot:GHVU01170278.1.p2 GENE.GHVU01170278.1~~GHVU01170278.1.p2  ORF type:complete len:151 (+),score=2.86 GHVU01170278.1:2189-2641(+)